MAEAWKQEIRSLVTEGISDGGGRGLYRAAVTVRVGALLTPTGM